MDGKKTDAKKSVKQLLGEYWESYTEGLPKSREELIDSLPRLLKGAGIAAGSVLLGYIFGSMAVAYSAIPFGTAYLAASKKNVVYIYIGLILSAITEKTGMALPLFLIYTALFISRLLIYRSFGMKDKHFGVFEESLTYRLIEGFSASLFISVYRAASFGFLYYDIFGGLFEITAVPLLIKLYDYVIDKKYKFSVKREIGLITLLASVVMALSDVYIYGFCLGTLAAGIVTLYISRSAGTLRGGVYGLICGLVCSPVISPVLALGGMAAGVLWRLGAASALSVSCLVCIVGGIYVEGWSFIPDYSPELMSAMILLYPFAQFGWLPRLYLYTEGITPQNDADMALMLAEKKQRDAERRFKALSMAFSELSQVFYMLSDRVRRPGLIDTRELCDRVCDNYCSKCLFKRTCWEKEYTSTQEVFADIARELCDKGYVEKSAVAGYMIDRCCSMDRILEKINQSHADLLERLIMQNKTEVFAMDYESMAHLLEAAVRINCEEYLPDEGMKKRLEEAAHNLKFYARNICVYGKRKLSVVASGVDMTSMKLTSNQLRECFENICEVRLDQPKFQIEGDYVTMYLDSKRRFYTEYAASTNTKRNETYCGDLVCMFENGHDYFYSLISDGMGSGKEAALTSRLCGVFLKKMLQAGNSKPVAMEMLNNFIRSKNTECFSTVDLLEIDLLNGKASFVKSGAVASYVKRGDKIFRIASNTMPVGITKEINAEEVKFDLQDNDVIVMVSDGVGQSKEDTVMVSNLLTFSWEDDLYKMVDKILFNACQNSGRNDDVSVGIVRVRLTE